MTKKDSEKKLVGPWRALHGALWLVGLAILAWTDAWWPGILILVALSALLEAVLQRYAPQAFEEPVPGTAAPRAIPVAPQAPVESAPPSGPFHPEEWLPTNCPKCGGPTRGNEVIWTGPTSADCPFCGTNLPMKRA
jgi:hypothetical protein